MKFKFNTRPFARTIADTLKRKVVSLVSTDFRMEGAKLYAEKIEPYVPKDTGRLRNSYSIVDSGKYIRYNTPYAEKVYTIPARHYTTPGTSHHWDETAKPYIIDEYKAEMTKLAAEYFKRTK